MTPSARARSFLALNSTAIYVLAFLVTTVIHELAHALVGYLCGSGPVLHHNFVEHTFEAHLAVFPQVAIALAGPVISLIQGLVASLGFFRSRRRGSMQLFVLWLAVLGFNNFLGYLMTGPFFSMGDIGHIYVLLGTPMILQIIFAVVGAGILAFIAFKWTRPFLQFAHQPHSLADGNSRKNFAFHIIILPWLIGSAVVTLLYLPVVAIISIIYPSMSGAVLIFPWQSADDVTDVKLSKNRGLSRASFGWAVALLVMIWLFKWVLAPGIVF